MKRYYFFEQVVTGGSQKQGYSLPDLIDNSRDVQDLINTIESDPELAAGVRMDDVQHQGSSQLNAGAIWKKLEKTPVGERLSKAYPLIKNYRISSVSTSSSAFKPGSYDPQIEGKPNTTREIDAYDKWGNSEGLKLRGQNMPSFREYMYTDKWRTDEISGGGAKQTPVSVATQKQTPIV